VRLLALDISTHVGFILFAGPGRLAQRDTHHLKPGTMGSRLVAFHDWLNAFVPSLRLDVLAFEEPIRGVPGRSFVYASTMDTQKLLQGLAAVAELVAARHGVPRIIEVPTSTAKKKLAGNGRAKKPGMIAAAVRMGVNVADEHQADALAVALVAYEYLGVQVRGGNEPLLDVALSRW